MIYSFFKSFSLKRRSIRLSLNVRISKRTILMGKNYIGRNSRVINSHVGFMSYIGSNTDLSNTFIGKYCSIGSNVKVINGFHPTNSYVSTHPCFYSVNNRNIHSYVKKQKYDEYRYAHGDYYCIIGNDVWLGNDVMIMGGVTIGDGAVIASGALVTHDVPPYHIVAGVPAHTIKKRFNDSIIERLLELKWWDKSEQWIEQRADLFDEVETFINYYLREEIDNNENE